MSINSVAVVGNLTRDPELRNLSSGTSLCSLRVAVNERVKDGNGQWSDRANYFDVTVWGKMGENCAQYLAKGSRVGVQGRLRWSEWDATDGSGKRQKVEIVAQEVMFLTPRREGDGQQQTGGGYSENYGSGESAPVGGTDDDIPF